MSHSPRDVYYAPKEIYRRRSRSSTPPRKRTYYSSPNRYRRDHSRDISPGRRLGLLRGEIAFDSRSDIREERGDRRKQRTVIRVEKREDRVDRRDDILADQRDPVRDYRRADVRIDIDHRNKRELREEKRDERLERAMDRQRKKRRRSRSRSRSRSPSRRRSNKKASSQHKKYLASYRQDWKDPVIWRDFFVEFVTTFFLTAVQIGVIINPPGNTLDGNLTRNSMCMSFLITIMISAFGEFGSVFMNPAVCFAMILSLKVSFIKGLFYIGIEVCGGIAGAAFMWAVTPESHRGAFGTTTLNPDVAMFQGYLMETFITAILVLTALGTTNAKRKHKYFFFAVPIGMAVGLGIFVGGNHSGGSMNPARSLGPAIMANIWTDHWIYWVGPLSGAAIAAFFYNVVFDLPDKHRNERRLREEKEQKEAWRRDVAQAHIATNSLATNRNMWNYQNGYELEANTYM